VTASVTFEPDTVLEQITTATVRLPETAAAFTDEDVRRPSLLPGSLLAWLLGRSDGAELGTRLPTPPFLY
jgi:hypothetical protein